MLIEHISNSPFSEHFKNHGIIFREENGIDNTINYFENYEIRRFTIGDIDAVLELYKEVFSSEPWNDLWISKEQVRYYLNELIENPGFDGFVFYENSSLVGACLGHTRSWWNGKEFFIDELFVANQMQGKGIGSKLMQHVEADLLMNDYSRIMLLTNKDLPAEEFYLKKGFNINQKRIIMVKNIFKFD
jgi:aminoglycoside 6'-N-acetyltransferase I